MSVHQFLKKRSSLGLYTISLALLALIYTLNLIAPRGLSFSIFYLGPIAMVAWYLGYWRGISIAVLSTLAWFHTEAISGAFYTSFSITYWNTSVRLITFIIIVYLLNALHKKFQEQERLADTDGLTGAMNTRGFMQRVENELERARRYGYACTLAYIDLDDFKGMNDSFGHTMGDNLLKDLVALMHQYTRASDVVGRLGGDEFAIFYTETDAEAALKAIRKLRLHINDHMEHAKWPVTLSIGAVTVDDGECDLLELIKVADNLMYSVKGLGKNNVQHTHFKEAEVTAATYL